MCGALPYVASTVIGKMNYNKGREILLPVLQQSQSPGKGSLSGRLDQEENYS
jgi:hypothetical protein